MLDAVLKWGQTLTNPEDTKKYFNIPAIIPHNCQNYSQY